MDINKMIEELEAVGMTVLTDMDLQNMEIETNKKAIKRQNSQIMDQRAIIKAQHKEIRDNMK